SRDPDVEIDEARPQSEDRVCVLQQHAHPTGTVVDPLDVADLLTAGAQPFRDGPPGRVVDRAGADERRRGEREPVRRASQLDEAGAALLDDAVATPRGP